MATPSENKLRKMKRPDMMIYPASKIADKIAKTETGKGLSNSEKTRAGKIIASRQTIDRKKALARATNSVKRAAAKASNARITAAVGGGMKKSAAKKTATKKKSK